MQFEDKTYKDQRKGFTEETGNFRYKLSDWKFPEDEIL